jgi:hypothetical protein
VTGPRTGESERDGGATPGPSDPGRPLLFPRNRRDGARLLSSTLVIAVIGLVGWQHGPARLVGLVATGMSLFWWLQYRKLLQ